VSNALSIFYFLFNVRIPFIIPIYLLAHKYWYFCIWYMICSAKLSKCVIFIIDGLYFRYIKLRWMDRDIFIIFIPSIQNSQFKMTKTYMQHERTDFMKLKLMHIWVLRALSFWVWRIYSLKIFIKFKHQSTSLVRMTSN